MGLEQIPADLQARYTAKERDHACSILAEDYPQEWADILWVLRQFKLTKTMILTKGRNLSPIGAALDGYFRQRGWTEKSFDIDIRVDKSSIDIPTHAIDNFKNRVGVEVEWNNKDPFYDRDLNNFRLLRDLRVLSVGVIITRLTELQKEFVRLGKGSSYGASTTHWNKLIPRVEGGGAGGCPMLLIGFGFANYDPNT